jgi:hypothetical protein
MKAVRWSAHAEGSLRDRAIDRREAERALSGRDRRIASRGGREIPVRRYDDGVLGRPMVVCVVVEERPEETVVVTVYWSSKLEKYTTGGAA